MRGVGTLGNAGRGMNDSAGASQHTDCTPGAALPWLRCDSEAGDDSPAIAGG